MSKIDNQENKETPEIYKKWEFKQFLGFVEGKNLGRALMYAKALGIDRRTMQKWMQQPELAKPLIDALDELLSNMQKAGKDDWRMHAELIKMLGLDDVKNIDLTSDGEKINIAMVEFVGGDNPDTSTNT